MKLFGIELSRGLVTLNTLETIGIVAWLALVTMATPMVGLGIGILFAFFLLEHVVAYNNFYEHSSLYKFSGTPWPKLVLISILETVVWVAWLYLIPISLLASIAVLLVGLQIHHVAELNVFLHRSIFKDFIDVADKSFGFTVTETVTGIVWRLLAIASSGVLNILAVIVLFVGLLFEHNKAAKVLDELE